MMAKNGRCCYNVSMRLLALLFLAVPVHANRTVMEGLAASNNTVYVDTVNVRVGIATTTPLATLDVSGNAMFGAGATRSTFTATPGNATYALNLSSGIQISGGGPIVMSANSYIQFGDGSKAPGITSISPWLLNGTAVYYNSGRVGVGTSAPNSTLDINGTSFLRGAGVFGSTLTILSPGLSVGTTALYLNSSGNIGIGNSSPSTSIHMSSGVLLMDGAGSEFRWDATNASPLMSLVYPGGSYPTNRRTIWRWLGAGFNQLALADDNFGNGIQTVSIGPFSSLANAWLIASTSGTSISGTLTTNSTASVKGNAFSVGGSSFSVSGGSATVAYSMTAKSFSGDGSGLTNLSSAINTVSTFTILSPHLSVGSTALYVTDGKIGIGTSNPGQSLHISSGSLLIDGIGSLTPTIILDGSVGNATLQSYTDYGNASTVGLAQWNTALHRVRLATTVGAFSPQSADIGGTSPWAIWSTSGTEIIGTLTADSTMSVVGNAFGVGGSSFTVSGGSATVAYRMTAGSFVGNGAGVTNLSGSALDGSTYTAKIALAEIAASTRNQNANQVDLSTVAGNGANSNITSMTGLNTITSVVTMTSSFTVRNSTITSASVVVATNGITFADGTNQKTAASAGTAYTANIAITTAIPNATTTASTFVNLAGSSVTLTTSAKRVHFSVCGQYTISGVGLFLYAEIREDGVTVEGGTPLHILDQTGTAGAYQAFNIEWTTVAARTAATHTYSIWWRVDNTATGTWYYANGNGGGTNQFAVTEIP